MRPLFIGGVCNETSPCMVLFADPDRWVRSGPQATAVNYLEFIDRDVCVKGIVWTSVRY